MPKIFICYRRGDSTHQAGRISDRLATHFGKDQIFKDVDNTPAGADFRQVLTAQVEACDVLLALIGDTWLTATDAGGGRRIDNRFDYVHYEIESALRRGIPVIPVLVGQISMPQEEHLPETLRELAYRQKLDVRPDPDFHPDVTRLIESINGALGPRAVAAGPRAGELPQGVAAGEPPKAGRGPFLGGHAHTFLEKALKGEPRGGQGVGKVVPRVVPAAERTLRIGILKSGNATYVNEIEQALFTHLRPLLAEQRIRLVPSTDCVEWGDEDQWPTTVNRLMTRGGSEGFRFVVGIGTQAGVALRDALGPEYGKVPTLLLGVTYPRVAGLVDSEHLRCESRQIACVRYGCGLDAVASLLYHQIFPGRKLCFVIQAGIPQDEMAYSELSTTRMARDGGLRLLRLERRLCAEDLADKETVYFSWYTFTRLFHDKEFSLLSDRLTVSIMQDNVRDGVASVGVGTDHDWIGERGAELIAEHEAAPLKSKPDWGTLEVVASPLLYWLNLGLAKKQGLVFPLSVRAGAREVYN
jgi:hypothetical protein